ncbi:MAG TPA: response regulator [Steroidobacteraceae bacterium]|nr:response regulator [Steroidobacteraceae bacterium]
MSQPHSAAPRDARRILIVDDNIDSAQSLAMLLGMSGYETHTAHDGVEAVRSAEQSLPAAVLLDIGLPGQNGYEACRRIRQQPWGKHMVLIALTGWGQDADREQAEQAGFDTHIVKPVDFEALLRMLESLLARTPAPGASARDEPA